jgi:hypothetical protein
MNGWGHTAIQIGQRLAASEQLKIPALRWDLPWN